MTNAFELASKIYTGKSKNEAKAEAYLELSQTSTIEKLLLADNYFRKKTWS